MQNLKIILPIWLFVMAVTYYGIFVMGNKPATKIIKETTDSRGLTSVIFTEGKDTFALDYLTKQEYDSVFICPKCGEVGCIYEAIDSAISDWTNQDEINNTIEGICKERGITNKTAIQWLKGDYLQ